jgi:16S rRNA (uracil1498-N3)-methyltransferase
MQRFFVREQLTVGATVQVDDLAPQLAQVLRLQAGDEIVLLDGSGHEFHSRLRHVARRSAAAEILAAQPCPAEPRSLLTLYQCSLKHDKFEWVLQKGTELGVSRFVPVISARSIVRPAAALHKKYDRWQEIVREAAEQSGRGRIPHIAAPLDWPAAVVDAPGVRLLPWEGAAPTLRLEDVLQQNVSHDGAVSILIGPEGGVTAEEAASATAQRWQLVSLGPRILRAETAALAAVAVWGSVRRV